MRSKYVQKKFYNLFWTKSFQRWLCLPKTAFFHASIWSEFAALLKVRFNFAIESQILQVGKNRKIMGGWLESERFDSYTEKCTQVKSEYADTGR